jgi:hypothetical protein
MAPSESHSASGTQASVSSWMLIES